MNLIIDQGNTKIKVALFEKQTLIVNEVFSDVDYAEKISNIIDNHPIKKGIVASVVKDAESRYSFLNAKIQQLVFVNSETPMPFLNEYATPKTLGVDRLALMAAAVNQFPNQNVLVIDAGSCITFDMMTSDGVYVGGAIAPGIQMRLRAMHEFTSKLPLIEQQNFDISHFIGKSTRDCMLSGVYHNVVCEIEGVIARYEQQFKNLTIILTGGDHLYLVENIKNRIFAKSFFLLEGLNAILEQTKER
ncbi:type III pantothenate kinase [Capnocytophaga canis]|uniref:Type III pantothenate kinase n=1 Tax=Capnocytophaga canis TaxID=1848903 RepID=A0A0B7IX08_9FLAO|nr:type III pantothenate kinase [Capnocytophaga canis]CEN54607.1 Type III pantothenate kinase [Capnocytophaga canis]